MPKFYPTGGAKNFAHGIDYQRALLLLLLASAVNNGSPFYLGTEVRSASSFDDIVLLCEINKSNGTGKEKVWRFLQIKHKRDVHEKISLDDLLMQGKNSKFGLPKYLVAYLKIENSAEFSDGRKYFAIATNGNFDSESLASKNILIMKIDTEDEFLNIGNSTRYKFDYTTDNVAKNIKIKLEKTISRKLLCPEPRVRFTYSANNQLTIGFKE